MLSDTNQFRTLQGRIDARRRCDAEDRRMSVIPLPDFNAVANAVSAFSQRNQPAILVKPFLAIYFRYRSGIYVGFVGSIAGKQYTAVFPSSTFQRQCLRSPDISSDDARCHHPRTL